MRLNQLIKENLDLDGLDLAAASGEEGFPSASVQEISFSDLSPQQVGILQKMADGTVDYELASDGDMDIMDELRDLGLLDQDWELSREGLACVQLAKLGGGSHDLQMARDASERKGTHDTFNIDGSSGSPDEFEIGDEEEFEFK